LANHTKKLESFRHAQNIIFHLKNRGPIFDFYGGRGGGGRMGWLVTQKKKLEILTTPHPNISFTNLVAFVKGWGR
jgi:hypothetical protein